MWNQLLQDLLPVLMPAGCTKGLEPVGFPRESAHGSLLHYIAETQTDNFQPMNITFGLLPPLTEKN